MDNDNFSIGIKRTIYHHDLKKLREEKGLSQQKVAEYCNMDTQTYGRIETLKQFPTEEKANAIADFFGVDTIKLFPKWALPIYSGKKKIGDKIIKIEKLALDSPSILQLPDTISPVEESVDRDLLKQKIRDALGTITDRERRVIEERFGLLDDKPKNLEECGRIFHVTGERIRQIEARALRRLRHPKRGKTLKMFVSI